MDRTEEHAVGRSCVEARSIGPRNAFDAIVVGAGPAGSSLAALLAHAGRRVLLAERGPRAGGRMATTDADGFSYELFPLNGVPRNGSRIEELAAGLGVTDEIATLYPDPVGRMLFELPGGEIRGMEISEHGPNPLKLAHLLGLPWWRLPRAIAGLARLARMTTVDIAGLGPLSTTDFLAKLRLPSTLETFLAVSVGEGYFQTAPDRLSAAAFVRAFQETQTKGGGRYYAHGIGRVFETFARSAERNGATLLFDAAVDRIIVEDGAVAGVLIGDTSYAAPVVVSTAGIQPTVLSLVGSEHFEPDYLDFVRGLETNLSSVGFRWVLDAPVLTSPMITAFSYDSLNRLHEFELMARGVFETGNYLYLGTTSLYPGLAPTGKQLVYACMSCLPDPRLDPTPYLAQVRRSVRKIQPDLFEHVKSEEVFGPATVAEAAGRGGVVPGRGGEDYGVALTPEQYGDPRLAGPSPITGLYFAGSDAGGFGLGTHQAVDSAANVANLVLQNSRQR